MPKAQDQGQGQGQFTGSKLRQKMNLPIASTPNVSISQLQPTKLYRMSDWNYWLSLTAHNIYEVRPRPKA